MSAQPSPEAVELVAAALRAERSLTVYEENCSRYNVPLRTSVHAAYVTLGDDATEKLWQYLIDLETRAAVSGRAA